MNLQTFFDNFDLLAEAPNGVQKLRELILQLAVQGKLVEQDPEDEPASVLLKRIRINQARLIKDKVIKRVKDLPAVKPEEVPFGIPESWEWVRLNDVGDWGAGATPDRKKHEYYDGPVRWFKSGELNDSYISESEERVSELALKNCSLRSNKPGDVLIAMYGATIGKLAILETEATTNQAVCACTCFEGIYNRFLFYILRAYRDRFTNQGAGGAQPNISREKIINTIAPLPPLDEQMRIVAKVDELMRLCDELEKRQQKRRETRVHLNNSALEHLLAANKPEEFNTHWQRICDNFGFLYDSPETTGKLRQSILQLTVQGQIVPQDHNDEPASVQFDKARDAINVLTEENGLSEREMTPEDVPYTLPIGWKWISLGHLVKFIGGSQPAKSKFIYEQREGYTRLIQIRDFKSDGFQTFVPNEFANRPFKEDDIMIGRYGPPVFQILRGLKGTYNVALMKASPIEEVLRKDFLYYLLQEPRIQRTVIAESERTAGQSGVRKELLHSFIVGLPPLKEQKRIVAKVDELMKLCDALETNLNQTQNLSESLTASIINYIFSTEENTTASAAPAHVFVRRRF